MQAQGLDRLDAQMLLLHVLDQTAHDRAWLLAHDSDFIDAATLQRLNVLVERRREGEPLAYITGHKEFFGLDLLVDERVLVPRPDTETLVEWALELLSNPLTESWGEGLLDLGTGSGAIALAIKSRRPDVRVTALDVSEDALAVPRSSRPSPQLSVRG